MMYADADVRMGEEGSARCGLKRTRVRGVKIAKFLQKSFMDSPKAKHNPQGQAQGQVLYLHSKSKTKQA